MVTPMSNAISEIIVLSFAFLTLATTYIASAARTPFSQVDPSKPAPTSFQMLSSSNLTTRQTSNPSLATVEALTKSSTNASKAVGQNIQNAQDIESPTSITGIKSFQPVTLWPRPAPVSSHVLIDPSDPQSPSDGESTHVMMGVDKPHAEGYFGKGTLIGIIDTVIDYTHPSLGGGFGAGEKVALGYDLVGDDYTGTNTPVPDSDSLDQCAGHGTHVAGIIGANRGNPYNVSEVAYQGTLAAYRVFGCDGSVADDGNVFHDYSLYSS